MLLDIFKLYFLRPAYKSNSEKLSQKFSKNFLTYTQVYTVLYKLSYFKLKWLHELLSLTNVFLLQWVGV